MSVPGATSLTAPTVVTWRNIPYVIYAGLDNRINYAYPTDTRRMTGWAHGLFPDTTPVPIAATEINDGQLLLAYTGFSNTVYTLVIHPGGGWYQRTTVLGSEGATSYAPALATLRQVSGDYRTAMLAMRVTSGQVGVSYIKIDNNSVVTNQWWYIPNSRNFGTGFNILGAPTLMARGDELRLGGRELGSKLVYLGGTVSQTPGTAFTSWGDWTWQPGFPDQWNMKVDPRFALIHGQLRALYADNMIFTANII
ncbi:hypothetical protein ACI2K4_23195 [Micromonospora sp. NPDC050397]|uniref:hypothetical protein n=1 Tax=Micromonospora sp. NPDC050397 TaxID=3364279 RepID=UPI00384D161E